MHAGLEPAADELDVIGETRTATFTEMLTVTPHSPSLGEAAAEPRQTG
jgi:hypothetical protein